MTDIFAPVYFDTTTSTLCYDRGTGPTPVPTSGASSGLVYNVSAFASLALADAAAVAAGGVLNIDTNLTLTANITLATPYIKWSAGLMTLGNFNLDMSAAIFDAPFTLVFALTGTGVPIFSVGTPVKIDWFGNNNVAMAAAISAVPITNPTDNNFTASGTLLGNKGTHYVFGTTGVVINKAINVDMELSYIDVPSNFTGIAVDVKQGSGVNNVIYNVTMRLPYIRQARISGVTSWANAATGVRLSNIRLSDIRIPQIYGFMNGIIIECDNTGFVQNRISVGRITNCKFGWSGNWVNSGASANWINGNDFFLGKVELAGGEPTSTAGCIYFSMIPPTTDVNIFNTNNFRILALETTDTNVTQFEVMGSINYYSLFNIENTVATAGSVKLLSGSASNLIYLANASAYGAQISDSGTSNSFQWPGGSVSGGGTGTWTPTCSAGTITVNIASYRADGNTITLEFDFTMPTSSSTAQGNVAGMPFAAADAYVTGTIGYNTASIVSVQAGANVASSTTMAFRTSLSGAFATFAQLSGKRIIGAITYHY